MHVRVKAEEVEVIPVADFEGFKERLTQMPDCYRYVCPKAERS
jgi:hypothetical protein